MFRSLVLFCLALILAACQAEPRLPPTATPHAHQYARANRHACSHRHTRANTPAHPHPRPLP